MKENGDVHHLQDLLSNAPKCLQCYEFAKRSRRRESNLEISDIVMFTKTNAKPRK